MEREGGVRGEREGERERGRDRERGERELAARARQASLFRAEVMLPRCSANSIQILSCPSGTG